MYRELIEINIHKKKLQIYIYNSLRCYILVNQVFYVSYNYYKQFSIWLMLFYCY